VHDILGMLAFFILIGAQFAAVIVVHRWQTENSSTKGKANHGFALRFRRQLHREKRQLSRLRVILDRGDRGRRSTHFRRASERSDG
jgi:hypothetical protein